MATPLNQPHQPPVEDPNNIRAIVRRDPLLPKDKFIPPCRPTERLYMVNFNGHLPCVIDTETTGLVPGVHDIVQIAIIPLNPDLTVSKQYPIFETRIKPKRPENAEFKHFEVSKGSFESAMKYGVDAWDAVDYFQEWFTRLRLPEKKQILPIGHNYAQFDRNMIQEWVGGPVMYNHYFNGHVRDTMLISAYINDVAGWHMEYLPFRSLSLGAIAERMNVTMMKAHDAISDALAVAEIYRKLMRALQSIVPAAPMYGRTDSLVQKPENLSDNSNVTGSSHKEA